MSYKEEMEKINSQILEAEKNGQSPSKVLYIKQIELLEKAHAEFLETAKSKGYDLNTNLDILEIEMLQFSAMKQLAQKIGIPTHKYDNYIRNARIRVYGKEYTEKMFYSKM